MAVSKDCADRRTAIERLVAEIRSLATTTDGSEDQLAALTAAHADPESIASVQERLSAERERLAELIAAGEAAVEEFRSECVGHPLPPGAAELLTAGSSGDGREAGAEGTPPGRPRP
ncbi:hypothetical protein AB0O91_29960 [Kitasatospora sp. NPDC089797]|uniref:hypothetical protein n=1 Tax=Kitasatospora sp. NPDC089797 TaxID=3155298 RepID=UPI0034409BCF